MRKIYDNVKSIMPQIAGWAMVVVYSAALFVFSGTGAAASRGLSQGIIRAASKKVEMPRFIRWIFEVSGLNYNAVLRKAAHVGVFLVLALLVYTACALCRMRLKYRIILTLLICFAYASLDELRQIILPGRTALAWDVLLDMAGAGIGILICRYLYRRKNKYYTKETGGQ